jgi:uncharacterized protein with PIN domain
MTFRFYGQLNDFLPPPQRGRRFTHRLRAPASVKDVIEALGVPHPEVDVILVDGENVDFAHRLQGGEEVVVYPVFRTMDIGPVRRTGSDPPSPVRFVLDVHLRKLAALLRLAGFDATLLDDDAEVAHAAADEGRVALTRDVGLLKRSVVRHGHWVRHTDPELQLAEILERFDLVDSMTPFIRCTRCNTPLVAVEAETVADRLPPGIRVAFGEFHHCPGCDRIYWQGTHFIRLVRLLERVRARARRRGGSRKPASAAASGSDPTPDDRCSRLRSGWSRRACCRRARRDT